MQINVNTDDNLRGGASLAAWVEREAKDMLAHFSRDLTRLEVHLGDENAGGDTEQSRNARRDQCEGHGIHAVIPEPEIPDEQQPGGNRQGGRDSFAPS